MARKPALPPLVDLLRPQNRVRALHAQHKPDGQPRRVIRRPPTPARDLRTGLPGSQNAALADRFEHAIVRQLRLRGGRRPRGPVR